MRASLIALTAVAAATAGVVRNNGDQPYFQQGSSTPAFSQTAADLPALAKGQRLTTGERVMAQAAPAAAPAVDESALRYFATQGDTVRLQAEISRLRSLYPNWQPPADPLAAATAGDPQVYALWKLYAEARYEEVEKTIRDRQASEPGWTAPAELTDGLRLARTRQDLVKASTERNFSTVITLATNAPQLLTCAEVDVMWRLAEAFAQTGAGDRARDAYAYILQNCQNTQERLATIEKAGVNMDAQRLTDLLKLEQQGPDGKPEFDSVRDNIARSQVAKGGGNAETSVPQTFIDRVETLAKNDGNAEDALLLGWYFYSREALEPASRWFGSAYERTPDASAAQGLALTRIKLGDPAGAEDVLYRFRTTNESTGDAYIAAVTNLLALDPPKAIDNAILARMAPAVITARDTAAAEQFGWYARLMQQMQTAAEWFNLALSWDQSYEPAAYGLAVSLDALGDAAGVQRLQAAWSNRSERIATLRDQRPPSRMVASETYISEQPAPEQTDIAPVRPQPRPAAQVRTVTAGGTPARPGCQTPVNIEGLPPASALARGWCLMDLKRPVQALAAFDRAMSATDTKTRQDAAYGKSLASLRLKLTDKAAAAAVAMPQTRERSAELETAILTDRAIGAFRAGRYNETIIALDQRARVAPDRQDLMILRGFAYQKLGYTAEARRIFQALANVGNSAALKALEDMRRS